MNNGFYTNEELKEIGFKNIGENCLISRKASFYLPEKIAFANNVRVDDFCILLGNITIGNYVHIAAYCGLHASQGEIVLSDFSCLSSNVTIYAASDDYSGKAMTNSTVPEKYRGTVFSNITLGKHSLIGTGTTVLPGAIIPEGVAVGAMSLVSKPLEPWGIYAGIPVQLLRERNKDLLQLEKLLLSNNRTEQNRTEQNRTEQNRTTNYDIYG
jgi:galactoside O-acetyltransferase